ncbi:MAG: DUF2064 domain-containing protein [Bacteroidota bacterium]|nr:DUF2064 domain-containing protein [Bacteroidota bacterium]
MLFTRTPQEEVSHKSLMAKRKVSEQKRFFQRLVEHARWLGHKSGLAFFVVDSCCQQGHTFGERLEQAFAAFFARGFSKVIIMGNDCAQLRTEDIRNAATLLQQKAAVFGPAQDGGVYLLGLDKALFEQNTGFSQIHWQTSTVFSELQAWCGNFETINLDPVYSDLDSYQDVRFAFYAKHLPQEFLFALKTLFTNIKNPSSRILIFVKSYLTPSFSFRGPPLFC